MPGSTFHGLDAYGSKPSLALALLRYKLAGFIDEDPK
jgi:hypothetical protein